MTHPTPEHPTLEQLEAGLPAIQEAPRDAGSLEMIVRRPEVGAREVLESGELDPQVGLRGDTWNVRASSKMPDRSPHPGRQITLMASRVISLVARDRDRWPLAGDQLFVDLDLSTDNLPAGTRLALGDAVLEITDQLHTGCKKFHQRFGADALRFVAHPSRRGMNLRGVYAKVVQPGAIRVGDRVEKLEGSPGARQDSQSPNPDEAAGLRAGR